MGWVLSIDDPKSLTRPSRRPATHQHIFKTQCKVSKYGRKDRFIEAMSSRILSELTQRLKSVHKLEREALDDLSTELELSDEDEPVL